MTIQEFTRLRTFENLRKRAFRPSIRVTSRRAAKSMKTATGQVLRNSRVQPQINLNKIFTYHLGI